MGMSKEEFTRQFMADQTKKRTGGGIEKPFTKWTRELTSDLYRLYEQKLSAEEIAERLGVDVKAVKNKLRNDKQRAKQAQKKRQQPAPVQETKKGVDEQYIEHLEGEFAKCKLELNDANELNRQLAEEVAKLNSRLKGYVEQIDVERDSKFQDLFFEAECLVDCIRGINTDEMKEPANTHILFDLLDSKLDAIYRQVPRVKKEDSETAGTAPEPK